jgi:hypothetical protein
MDGAWGPQGLCGSHQHQWRQGSQSRASAGQAVGGQAVGRLGPRAPLGLYLVALARGFATCLRLPRHALGLGNRLGRLMLGLLRCSHIFVADYYRVRGQEVLFTQGC